MTYGNSTGQGGRSPGMDRRRLMGSAGLGAGALALGAVAGAVGRAAPAQAQVAQFTDVNILNFALNLEYLEAEYYIRAVYGAGLPPTDLTGVGMQGSVSGGSRVPFATPIIAQYAAEIAADELAHVRFLRAALGSQAVAEPSLNLDTSFTAAAVAAGVVQPGQTFNPFQDENGFLLGAFIFEDVGVTAYRGAAPYIRNREYLSAAAGILGTEAYHASEIRVLLLQRGLAAYVQQVSDARDALDGPGDDDQGVLDMNGNANIVPTDGNGLVFARTFDQVKNIVYLGGAANNYGFFPNLMNGELR